MWPRRGQRRYVFHLKGVAATWHPTGSGDTALNYVLYAGMAAIAVVGTLVWTILDQRREEYRTGYAWLQLGLRFTVAVAMLAYGFSKVFPKQFGTPGLEVLTQAYGDSTPMRLLWTSMGSSTLYRVACGLGEVLGGALLLFRRTSTVGALVSAAILSNVVLLNFSYDVRVKLYSYICSWRPCSFCCRMRRRCSHSSCCCGRQCSAARGCRDSSGSGFVGRRMVCRHLSW